MGLVVIVLPYGEPELKGRTALEFAGYMQYLRRCAEVVADLKAQEASIRVVIPSVESETVQPVFEELGDIAGGEVTVQTATQSTTTPGGIMEGWGKCGQSGDDLLILCDDGRRDKVRVLASMLISDARRIEVMSFRRPDITYKSKWWFQLLETIVLVVCPHLLRRRF